MILFITINRQCLVCSIFFYYVHIDNVKKMIFVDKNLELWILTYIFVARF